MNDEAILKDKLNRFPPKIVFFENVISPLGSSETKDNINNLVALINLVKKGGGVVGVSKISTRYLDWLIQNMGYVMLVGIVGMAIYFGIA